MAAPALALIPIPTEPCNDTPDLFRETDGPRVGIALSHDQASRLLSFHLPRHHHLSSNLLPPSLKQLYYFDRGFNNRVYLACCDDGSEYVIRLGGRFWDHRKITNETQALEIARSALLLNSPKNSTPVQVPTIIGTSIDESKEQPDPALRIIPHDYLIMNRLPGIPLDTVWDQLDKKEKLAITDQIVDVFAALQSIKLERLGNFVQGTPNAALEPGPEIVGPMMEGGGGPFSTWRELVAANIQRELQSLNKAQERIFELAEFKPRIQALLTKIENGQLEQMFATDVSSREKNQGSERDVAFVHGDFATRNFLIEGTQVVGLLDFEFAGAFPVEYDWCAGLDWLYADAIDPLDTKTAEERLAEMTDEQKELLAHFRQRLETRYGIRPLGVWPDDREYKVVLYHLTYNIAPWWIVDLERSTWTDNKLKNYQGAVLAMERALTYFGC